MMRACCREKCVRALASRPARREECPRPAPWTNLLVANSGVSKVTAAKLAKAPAAAAMPKIRCKSDRRHDARDSAGTPHPLYGARCRQQGSDAPAGTAAHILDEVDGIAGAHHQCQRGHDAGQHVHRSAGEPQNSHGPQRPNKGGQAGHHKRADIAGHCGRHHHRQRQPQAIEHQHIPTQGPGGLLPQCRQPRQGACQRRPPLIPLGHRLLDPVQRAGFHPSAGGSAGGETDEHERGRGVGREEVAGNQWMAGRPGQRRGASRRIEGFAGARDERQQGTGRSLPPDVVEGTHAGDAVDRLQLGAQQSQGLQPCRLKEMPRGGGGPDDAVVVGRAEAGRHLVDQPELGIVVAEQGSQVVVEPQSGNADAGQDRQDRNENQDAAAAPSWGGSRCCSSGSTIQPRQLADPQRQGMAASAGQQ